METVALGGLEENGKNTYFVEKNDEIIVIDAGSKKFDNSALGIDSVISDYTYLIENKHKIKGILISHAHLDQMGGISQLLNQLDSEIAVYGSNYTIEFLSKNIRYKNYRKINYNSVIKLGNFNIESFSLSHAVFGNYGYLLENDGETVVYATDYNFNQSRKENNRTDIDKIIYLKNKYKINLLMTESLSADKVGSAAGDTSFLSTFRRYAEMATGKLFVSLYSTNVSGMLNVISLAEELNKKIVIVGRDLLTYVNISRNLGYIEHKSDMFIKIANIDKYEDNEIIVVVAGIYLEPFESLQKLANPQNSITTIKETDNVLIASHPQDEIEGTVQKILDKVARTNCHIKFQKINVPAHAHQEDIKMMINLFDPQNVMPIKGEYRKFKKVEQICVELGFATENIHILTNGEKLFFDNKSIYKNGKIRVESKLINEKSQELINPILLQDRETISEEGYVLITLTYNKKDKKMIGKPHILSGGLMSFDDDKELNEKCIQLIEREIEKAKFDEVVIKIKNKLKRYLSNQIGKNPLILTVKIEMNSK